MSVKYLTIIMILSFWGFVSTAHSQQIRRYDLVKLMDHNKLDTNLAEIAEYVNPKNHAIAVKGIVWIKGVTFKEGTIDVDLRGRNIFM